MMNLKIEAWEGYPSMVETILKVNGMMCGMCESHINDVVRKNAEVNNTVTGVETKPYEKKGFFSFLKK